MIRLLRKVLSCLTLILVSFNLFAQTKTITGVVSDNNNNPLAGATISANNLKKATTTDATGSFSLIVPGGTTLITISYVGMADTTVSVENTLTISVSLHPSNAQLNEVVVIGYGTQKRKDVTGSVASVSAATIAKIPVVSAAQALQGRAAGVQVTNNDGAPGGNINVQIRGTGSLASGW